MPESVRKAKCGGGGCCCGKKIEGVCRRGVKKTKCGVGVGGSVENVFLRGGGVKY